MKNQLDKGLLERFSRQIILKDIGIIGQKKIISSKVLIIGAGGLGCSIAEFLARAGIGIIGIVDNDKVNLSNLHRQSLYQSNDIGKSKVMVVKNKIKLINSKTKDHDYEEIAKILTNIVDFEVFITNNEDKLDIFIKHPKHEPRPLEMGSGAEKTIASMAIRLAFLTVSNLPKPDLFILDEPGTALDEENMEGFVRILEMIKGYFKTVILISHLDSLKDCVDMQINIERKDGFAYVNI